MTVYELAFVQTVGVLAIEGLVDEALKFAEQATSKNTRRTYGTGWRMFERWCAKHGADPMTQTEKEGLIALYVTDLAKTGEFKISSINTYVAAICSGYKERGISINLKNQALERTLRGVRNTMTKKPNRKEPILTEDLKAMVQSVSIEEDGEKNLLGSRDRALLLLGFAGAFRRSELVSLCVEDLTFTRDGFVALVRKSKTDQEGAGHDKMIPYGANPATCPVRAVQDWLSASKITSGPLFRAINRHGHISELPLTGFSVGRIIKRNAYIQSKGADKFGGHSLRAGFVTEGVIRGVPRDLLMAQTGHKSSVIDDYIRRKKDFSQAAAAMMGL